MLAWLALEGPTPRHRLAHLLWPESDSAAAHNALRQRIFKLRKLGGSEIVVGRTTLSLAAHVEHDLADGSPVLGDVDHRFAGEIATWLEQRREHCRQRLRRTLVERFEAARAEADDGAALDLASELLALEPLSEEAHRRVIRLHYLRGDRPLALLAFDRCEKLLKDEVGAAPSDETLALLSAIERSGDPAALAADHGDAHPARLPATVLRPPQRIGRIDVWAALCRARDTRRVMLLAGEAGLGKSRLLLDLAQSAAGSVPTVLLMNARLGDAAVPYALLTRGMRTVSSTCAVAADSAHRQTLSQLLPEQGIRTPMRRGADSARLADALQRLLAEAADRGLEAVAVDDLQFADEASIAMLQGLIASGTLGWLIAYRPAELTVAAHALVDALERSADVESATLQPWDRDDTLALLASLDLGPLGSPDRADSLHRRTGGNPLYVLETLKAALTPRYRGAAAEPATRTWPVAPNVSRLIEQRLMRLSPLALQVARSAAVAGQDSSSSLIADTLGLRPLDLADAWLELERGQIFVEGRFAHDLIAEAAASSVPEAIARVLHADIAGWLERAHGEPARIASHWSLAGEPSRAVPHLRAAGLVARNAWRLAQSADLFEQAGRILRDAGERSAAFDAFLSAADAYFEIGTDHRLLSIRDALATVVGGAGQQAWVDLLDVAMLVEERRFDDAIRLIDAALQRAESAGDADAMSELYWCLVVIRWERRESALAIAAAERALSVLATIAPEARRLGASGTELKLTYALGMLLSTSGRFEQGARLMHDARAIAIRSDDRLEIVRIDLQLACTAMDQGDMAGAMALLPGLAGTADAAPDFSTKAVTETQLRARVAIGGGDIATALRLYERIAPFCESGGGRATVLPLVRLARLHFMLGRRDLATRALDALLLRADLLEVDWCHIHAARVEVCGAGLPVGFVERAGAIDDFTTRVNVLCLGLPAAEAGPALALLELVQRSAREFGAHGLELMLQSARVAVLRRGGRMAEAAADALGAWRLLESGVQCAEPLPTLAAVLCPALTKREPEVAAAIAARALAWMQSAAVTLPDAWRDNYLQRSPTLTGIRA